MDSKAGSIFARKMEIAGVQATQRIAIAVSGGPDSIALCLLALEWKKQNYGSSNGLIGMTVDHGFRPESAAETVQVHQWLRNIGMECEILKCCWPEGIPSRGHLQQSARRARYGLLQDACKKYNASVLLTAHHADDQAELFVLRLSRSSGANGLAGMALSTQLFPYEPSSNPHKLLLVRPLMDFFKADLYQICRNAGQDWIEDPTNKKMVYTRNRIRKALSVLSCPMKNEIQNLISTYRKARSDSEGKRNALLTQFAYVNTDLGFVTIDVEGLFSATTDQDVRAKVIVAVLQFVAQKGMPPRTRVIQAIMDWLHDSPIRGARTGGRCCLFSQTGSKGTKVIVTFQPDVIRPPKNLKHQKPSGVKGIASASSEKHLMEARALGLISEGTASLLSSLSKEMAKDMLVSHDEGDSEATSIQQDVVLEAGMSLYFMERFNISWWQEASNEDHSCCLGESGCFLKNTALAKLRFFQDKDVSDLERLGFGKMDSSMKLLRSLPKYVQRGLIVLTTQANEMIGIPTVGIQICPNTRMNITFCPRVALGGGECSWS